MLQSFLKHCTNSLFVALQKKLTAIMERSGLLSIFLYISVWKKGDFSHLFLYAQNRHRSKIDEQTNSREFIFYLKGEKKISKLMQQKYCEILIFVICSQEPNILDLLGHTIFDFGESVEAN